MGFFNIDLQELPARIITMLIAFTIHEFSHAYVAYKFGDPTAKRQGRLTLNPIEHIDPIGALMLVFFGFGWARPVPVNYFHFKNKRLAGITVSLAGPVSNILLTLLGFLIWTVTSNMGLHSSFTDQFFSIFTLINIWLFIFNLLPIPPLDGFHIVQDALPRQQKAWLSQYEKYGVLIFVILVMTPLGDYILDPIFDKFGIQLWFNLFNLFQPY